MFGKLLKRGFFLTTRDATATGRRDVNASCELRLATRKQTKKTLGQLGGLPLRRARVAPTAHRPSGPNCKKHVGARPQNQKYGTFPLNNRPT